MQSIGVAVEHQVAGGEEARPPAAGGGRAAAGEAGPAGALGGGGGGPPAGGGGGGLPAGGGGGGLPAGGGGGLGGAAAAPDGVAPGAGGDASGFALALAPVEGAAVPSTARGGSRWKVMGRPSRIRCSITCARPKPAIDVVPIATSTLPVGTPIRSA